MKKTTYLWTMVLSLVAVLSTTSCNRGQEKQQKIDSLTSVNASIQKQMEETDQLIASVLGNFQEIENMETKLNTKPLKGETSVGYSKRVETNMRTIAEMLQKNKNDIEALNKKLEKMGSRGVALRRTIHSLQKQLKSKTIEVKNISEELKRKNVAIEFLDSQITDLSENVAQLQKAEKEKEELMKAQEKLLNTVSYCIGTKSDLKEMKVLVKGELATEGYAKDYFTEIDLRQTTSIPTYAKKAKLLTAHPESSYKLEKGTDGLLILKITNPKEFWNISKTLVIRIY